jgi:hypothetical protein
MKRVIMRVEVDPPSKDRLDEFCEKTGMTKIAVVSRLIDWFCEQGDTVQALVQGLYPKRIEGDIAQIILERLAKTKRINGKSRSNGRAVDVR